MDSDVIDVEKISESESDDDDDVVSASSHTAKAHHPRAHTYKFNSAWLERYSWLRYSEEPKPHMWCYACSRMRDMNPSSKKWAACPWADSREGVTLFRIDRIDSAYAVRTHRGSINERKKGHANTDLHKVTLFACLTPFGIRSIRE
jgi:hypothetical protein